MSAKRGQDRASNASAVAAFLTGGWQTWMPPTHRDGFRLGDLGHLLDEECRRQHGLQLSQLVGCWFFDGTRLYPFSTPFSLRLSDVRGVLYHVACRSSFGQDAAEEDEEVGQAGDVRVEDQPDGYGAQRRIASSIAPQKRWPRCSLLVCPSFVQFCTCSGMFEEWTRIELSCVHGSLPIYEPTTASSSCKSALATTEVLWARHYLQSSNSVSRHLAHVAIVHGLTVLSTRVAVAQKMP